jgi:hypothetical protein
MYAAIVQEVISLIRAVKLESDNEVGALEECAALERDSQHMLRVYFLLNTENGDIKRVFSGSNGYRSHPSAYDYLGLETAKETFEQSELNLEGQ